MSDYAKMAEAAVGAVASASRVCRRVQKSMDAIRSIVKDDKSPVTIADYASQAVVGRELRARLSGGKAPLHLVGEETSAQLRNPEHAHVLNATVEAVREVWPDVTEPALLDAVDLGAGDTHYAGFWTLDPIDGTKGFLRGQQYCVSLAYIEHGIPVLGVLGCPNLPKDFSKPLDEPDAHGCMYWAIRGQGVMEGSCDLSKDAPTRLRRLERAPGEGVAMCESQESGHSDQGFSAALMKRLGEAAPPARLDSQCKYAVVARGQAHAYLRLPTKKDYVERIWDHAAGCLVAVEAGCIVSDVTGKPLDFSRGRGLEANKGVVCCAPDLHARVIEGIRELSAGR